MKEKKAIFVFLSLFVLIWGSGVRSGAGAAFSDKTYFDPFMRATLLSGPVTDVPWQNDADFIEAKEKNKCPLLMAAYKAVLRDPLPGEEANVHLAAKYISGTVLFPGKVFSQNETAGPYTYARGYRSGPTYMGTTYSETIGGGVCKIASTLYNTAVSADLQIIERHNHTMPVPYVPYGQDATVSYGSKDFKFRNSAPFPVLIWARGVGNVLYIGFYGQAAPPIVLWSHDVIKVIKAPVLYKKNVALAPKTESVAHEGMDGALINSYILRIYPDGTSTIKDMGQCYYNPLPWIIERND